MEIRSRLALHVCVWFEISRIVSRSTDSAYRLAPPKALTHCSTAQPIPAYTRVCLVFVIQQLPIGKIRIPPVPARPSACSQCKDFVVGQLFKQ